MTVQLAKSIIDVDKLYLSENTGKYAVYFLQTAQDESMLAEGRVVTYHSLKLGLLNTRNKFINHPSEASATDFIDACASMRNFKIANNFTYVSLVDFHNLPNDATVSVARGERPRIQP